MVGVCYNKKDYAGLFRRLIALIIDSIFIIVLSILVVRILNSLSSSFPGINNFSYLWVIFVILYFTIIKSSKIRTLGFWITGIRIVDLSGQRPSHFKILLRFFSQILAPFQFTYDIALLVEDENKQSFRDKFAGTYIIRKNAKPLYENKIVANYYFVHGFAFVFNEVLRKDL